MVSLNQWLQLLQTKPTALVADIRATCNVSIYPKEDKQGKFTGRLGIQVNFPTGDEKQYQLYGFLEPTHPNEVTPETIGEVVQRAFAISGDEVIWQPEDVN